MSRMRFVGVGLLLAGACGGGDGSAKGAGDGGGLLPDGGSVGPGGGNDGSGGGDGPGDPSFTPVYGRFGVPATTFTLPRPAGDAPAISIPDVQAKHPEVDWGTLDRLYIPAGAYRSILIGGLPDRTAARPLVITNLGGQVKVGGLAANHVVVLQGGKNWILTGRYDPTSKTGDAGFRGHLEGAFAHSSGTYGIFIDDAFSKTGLSGVAIGAKATGFEVEAIEVARVEFAGIVAKTDNDGSATMHDVRLHDVYIHDVGSEGIYFGSTQAQPQHAFEGLHVYDNRILRTGTEALQVGQLGAGCEIDHNVLGPGAIRWRSAFAQYQDGNVQYGQRYGSSSFHHNVVVGAGDLFVELFPQRVDGDARAATDKVSFTDNYFADSSSSGVFTHAGTNGATIEFARNTFAGFRFDYAEVYPTASPPAGIFAIGNGTANPHLLADNVTDGPYPFFAYSPPAIATLTNNTKATVPRVVFRDFMNARIDEDYRRVEWWTDRATLAPGQPAVTYERGAFVMHLGVLYEATADNTNRKPDESPDVWKALPAPADDTRLAATSPHADRGLRWPPPR
ncbi:MAG: right-handed parallel beta-helix repeat-containing protein [Labilithrix sp.]|nr:right-handed parallel beta-helix repeat-containing protein [Labilithrix sp.]MCW5810360.1 right-handed parallel beta-helix repeat-containing protein [Labilithrix sp.]